MAFIIGDEILGGKYRIVDVLREGSFGKVYLAGCRIPNLQVTTNVSQREHCTAILRGGNDGRGR